MPTQNTESVINSVVKEIDTNKELAAKIIEINKEIEKNEQKIITIFVPYLNEIYSKWRPRIDESVVMVNLGDMNAFEVNIVSIDGIYIRAKEGDKKSYHNFFLHNTIEEYEVPNFPMPVSTFNEIAKKIDINILKTMRKRNGKIYYENPDFA